MPALPPVAKVIRFTFKQTYSADLDVINHLFYQGAAAATAADTATAAEQAENAWETNMLPIQTPSISLVSVTATALDSSSAPQTVVPSGNVGTAAGNSNGAGMAMVVSLTVARRFRGGHPRLYIAGLSNNVLATPQTWTAGAVAAWLAAFNAMDVAIKAGVYANWTLPSCVNVRYFQGFTVVTNPITHRARNVPNPIPGGPVTEAVTGFNPRNKVGSQRRRNLQSA